jgi:hypothetical protein
MKHRAQLSDEGHTDHVRSMHPDEFVGVELRNEAGQRFSHQVDFAGGVHLYIVPRRADALNILHREEKSAI